MCRAMQRTALRRTQPTWTGRTATSAACRNFGRVCPWRTPVTLEKNEGEWRLKNWAAGACATPAPLRGPGKRRLLLAVGVDDGLSLRPGRLDPVGRHGLANACQFLLDAVAGLGHGHAFGAQLFDELLVHALARGPAALFGGCRCLQHGVLPRLVEGIERLMVYHGGLARKPCGGGVER